MQFKFASLCIQAPVNFFTFKQVVIIHECCFALRKSLVMEIEFFSLSLSLKYCFLRCNFRFIGLRSVKIVSAGLFDKSSFFLFIGDLANFFGNLTVLYLEKLTRLRYELSMIAS